jgi:uncharacterized protein
MNSLRWRPGVAEKLGYYVYVLSDPNTNAPFYVGKGLGDRCFSHLVEARHTSADTKGDYQKLQTIRSIEASGAAVRIDVLRHGLDEQTAFIVEAAAIDLLRLALTNRVAGQRASAFGRMDVDQINALHGARQVDFDPTHRVVLIRVAREFHAGIEECDLYDATRRWWRVQERRRLAGSPWAPQWAMAVYRGVVRAVYRIDGWEPWTDNPKPQPRWGFFGPRDTQMESRYQYADVTGWLPPSAQFPLRYVNCAPTVST